MKTEDKKAFVSLIEQLCVIYGKDYSHDLAGMYWKILDPYQFQDITKAATIHCTESKFFPRPADLIEQMPDQMGWLKEEEAWNRVPKDENTGGYVTDEMMQGWGAASDSLRRCDYIGGRMAFREAYAAAVKQARLEGRKPRYWYSGASMASPVERAEQKIKHIAEAEGKGWITNTQAQKALMIAGKFSEMPQNIKQLVRKEQLRLTANGSDKTEKK